MLLLSGCMQLPSTATEGKEVRYAHNKKREALTEDTRLDLGPLGAAAVLRARTDVLVDSALAHATAALGGGHRFGRVLLVEVVEAAAALVALPWANTRIKRSPSACVHMQQQLTDEFTHLHKPPDLPPLLNLTTSANERPPVQRSDGIPHPTTTEKQPRALRLADDCVERPRKSCTRTSTHPRACASLAHRL